MTQLTSEMKLDISERNLKLGEKAIYIHIRMYLKLSKILWLMGAFSDTQTPFFPQKKKEKQRCFQCKIASKTNLTVGEKTVYRDLRMYLRPSKICLLIVGVSKALRHAPPYLPSFFQKELNEKLMSTLYN